MNVSFKKITVLICAFWAMILQGYGETYSCHGGIHTTSPITSAGSQARSDIPRANRWSNDGTNTVVTFSFVLTPYTIDKAAGHDAGIEIKPIINESKKVTDPVRYPADTYQLILKAFEAWEAVADISFKELNEADGNIGQIRIAKHKFSQPFVLGHGFFPPSKFNDVAENDISGDLHLKSLKNWKRQKGLLFAAVVHEIGHSLGLQHLFATARNVNEVEKILPLTKTDNVIMYGEIGNNAGPLSNSDKAYIQSLYNPPSAKIINGNGRTISWQFPHDPFISSNGNSGFNPLDINQNDTGNPFTARYTGQFAVNVKVQFSTMIISNPSDLTDLDNKTIPENIKSEFANHNTGTSPSLTSSASVTVISPGSEWQIEDRGAVSLPRKYILKKVNNTLEFFEIAFNKNDVSITSLVQSCPLKHFRIQRVPLVLNALVTDNAKRAANKLFDDTINDGKSLYWTRVDNGYLLEIKNAPTVNARLPLITPLIATDSTVWRFTRSYILSSDQTIKYRVFDADGNLVTALSSSESGAELEPNVPSSVPSSKRQVDLSTLEYQKFSVDYFFTRGDALPYELVHINDIEFENVLTENGNYVLFDAVIPTSESSFLVNEVSSIDSDYGFRTVSVYNDNYSVTSSPVFFRVLGPAVKNVNAVPADKTYNASDINTVITLEIVFTTKVIVTIQDNNMPPTLSLDNVFGGSAEYQSGSGTNTLKFRYTITKNDNTFGKPLNYSSTKALDPGGSTLTDSNSTIDLTLPEPDSSNSLGSSNILIDTITPIVTVNRKSTNDTTPDLSGTIDDNSASVSVSIDGESAVVAENRGNRTWLLPGTFIEELSDGIHEIQVTATDSAGNVGTDSTTSELIIDTRVLTILNAFIAADNRYIELRFNNGVYGDKLKSSPVGLDDFDLSVNDAGVMRNSVKFTKIDGRDLEGGESNIRIEFSLSVAADKNDIITIEPKPNSIYDGNGIALTGKNLQPVRIKLNEIDSLPEFTVTLNVDPTPIPLTFGQADTIMDPITKASSSSIFYFEYNSEKIKKQLNPLSETPTRWILKFSPDSGQTGHISWEISNTNPNYRVYLQKINGGGNTNNTFDLTDSNLKSIPVSETSTFKLVYGPLLIETVPALAVGWNLVSMPLILTKAIDKIFADTVRYPIWFWDGDTFQLMTNNNALLPNIGHWIYFNKSTRVTQIEGIADNSKVTVGDGWNLIGTPGEILSLSNMPDSDHIQSAWKYNSTYTQFEKVTGSLSPFHGMWIFRKE